MSIDKNKFIEVWERIKQETDLKTMGQLAELIGKTQQKFLFCSIMCMQKRVSQIVNN